MKTANGKRKDTPEPHHRCRTVLLLVSEVGDVAPIGAMCALMGDLYRHRTYFSNCPVLVIRVAVVDALRHYFVSDNSIIPWRAHEASPQSWTSRWKTHVGAPDSIWSLDQEDGLSRAFWGTTDAKSVNGKPSFLRHDDGGMADMILVGRSSFLNLTMWHRLAQLLESFPNQYTREAPPLVLATLGNTRGLDWLSRMGFSSYNSNNKQQPSSRRPIAFVGFPSPLWYCRSIQNTNAKRIRTNRCQESSLVLMVGRDTSSVSKQSVSIISTTLSELQQNDVLKLLQQTLFLPKTELELMPFFPVVTQKQMNAKPYVYRIIWWFLQDPHMIQFPCCLALGVSDSTAYTETKSFITMPPSWKPHTLGSLILVVLEEVLLVLHQLHANSNRTTRRQQPELDETFCETLTRPFECSLVAQLLGIGGILLEDLTNNRLIDLITRLKLVEPSFSDNKRLEVMRQRWMVEPLMTRAAMTEWRWVTQQSPLPDGDSNPVLLEQIRNDCIPYGLGLIWQLGTLLKLEQRLPNIKWVLQIVAMSDNFSAMPLSAFGVHNVNEFYNLLVKYPPFGPGRDVSVKARSRL